MLEDTRAVVEIKVYKVSKVRWDLPAVEVLDLQVVKVIGEIWATPEVKEI